MTDSQVKYRDMLNTKTYRDKMVKLGYEENRIRNEEAKIRERAQSLAEARTPWDIASNFFSAIAGAAGRIGSAVITGGGSEGMRWLMSTPEYHIYQR